MKIGIVSDSHDNLPMIRKALELLSSRGAEMLLHAGDFVAPFAVRELLKFPGRVIGVFGNNDGERRGIAAIWPEVAEPPKTVVVGGRTIVIAHQVEQVSNADLSEADVFVCGHNHKPSIERKECLRINPGELGGWLTGRCSAALLDTETLEVELIDVG